MLAVNEKPMPPDIKENTDAILVFVLIYIQDANLFSTQLQYFKL